MTPSSLLFPLLDQVLIGFSREAIGRCGITKRTRSSAHEENPGERYFSHTFRGLSFTQIVFGKVNHHIHLSYFSSSFIFTIYSSTGDPFSSSTSSSFLHWDLGQTAQGIFRESNRTPKIINPLIPPIPTPHTKYSPILL
jgi:hypothetical protein